MADHCAVTIPAASIDRIRLYINTARKSLAAIRAETGADYLLNGTLYDMASYLPVCHIKADGEVLCRPGYSVAGYAWDRGADIAMVTLPDGARQNYIACTPLVVDGRKVETLTYDLGQGGTRGRSAIGIKDGRLALYCTRDGGTMARTPEQLRDDLFAAGWESAIMLDGGGSSQCDFAGRRVESSRAVHDLILVYLKKEGDTVNETKTVVLDAGHDASNLANRSPDGTYYEHEFCLDMAKRMGAHLRRCGVTVVETRPDGAAVTLAERCAIANNIQDLDLFVSLHSNAAGGSGWSSARGWSAYLYGTGGEREQAAQAILARVRETGTAWGSPYAGSSRCFCSERCPIGAIVVLEQAPVCAVRRLSAAKAFHRLYPQLTVNSWNGAYVERASGLLAELAAQVPVYLLECTPDDRAVETLANVLKEDNALGFEGSSL